MYCVLCTLIDCTLSLTCHILVGQISQLQLPSNVHLLLPLLLLLVHHDHTVVLGVADDPHFLIPSIVRRDDAAIQNI